MTPFKWILLTFGVGLISAYVYWWYGMREEPVRGRALAATFRALALLLLLLLLLNPSFPAGWRAAATSDVVILDASFSMSRPAGLGSSSIWQAARDSMIEADGVWLFGGADPQFSVADSLPLEPIYYETRLTPAIRSSALAGARTVRVITDDRIADVAEAADEARRQGIGLFVTSLRTEYEESGISEIVTPSIVRSGDTVSVRVDVVASAAWMDTLRVEIVDDVENVRASVLVERPGAGRFAPARLAFVASGRPGYQRFEARLASDRPDPETRDDRRPFYLRIEERPISPVLISLVPDWEPSFLLPNLDRASDTPVDAYFWLADSLISLPMYIATPVAEVQRRARQAPLLILHGYGSDAPTWVQDLARRATRLLVLPTGVRAFELPGWNVSVGSPASGEWYASAELPASPIALQLSGFPEDQLAPLLRVRTVDADRTWEPLLLLRMRRGEATPALVAGRAGNRRWAVATAEGYWRWAFRQGAGRQLYRALWTGVAGWLLEGRSSGEAGLQPLQRVVERGQPLRWVAPAALDSLIVEMNRDVLNAGSAPQDAESEVWRGVAGPGDTLSAWTDPGPYQYVARAFSGGRLVAELEGPAEVEEYASELLPGADASLGELATEVDGGAAFERAGRSKGLAALGWPYLVVIVLFCAEWAVRRFVGLR